MIQLASMQAVPRVAVAVAAAVACATFDLGAAPTTGADEVAIGVFRDAAVPFSRPLAPSDTGSRALDGAVTPEVSTGDKDLDRLLELQGTPWIEERRTLPRADAAASAAAAALASLRARAAERPAAEINPAKVSERPFDGMTQLEGTDRAAAQSFERREWTSQLGGGGGGTDPRRDPYRTGDLEADGVRGSYDDDNLLRRLPREVIAFLRESRYWLLGALSLVAVLGAVIKAFSRRI